MRATWEQPRQLTVSEWADAHRVLDPRFASEPGPWHTDRVPYAREWMDSCALPWVRRVTTCASTQVGKTEAVNNVLGFYMHQRPSPAMLVMPNADAARVAGERRILPMIQASAALRAEMTDRSHDAKTREIALRNSICYLRSASSPTELASVPVRLVLGDEVEKWPRWSGREASPLALVAERTRTYTDSHVIVLTSTPSTRHGLIQREFERGDQRRYHVPCTHCGAFLVFSFPQVKWPAWITTGNLMRSEEDAWYQCDHCGEKIDDRDKRKMVARGVWVPHGKTVAEWLRDRDEDRNEHRSYHLWAAYSPWVTWWRLAAQYLDAKDEPAEMMNFTNSWLAEVWEDKVATTTDAEVAACVDAKRPQGTMPAETLVVTAAVDVQGDRLEWAVVGWGLDEESWLISAGKVPFATDGGDWARLGDILFRNTWGEKQLRIRCCVVDARYRHNEVVDFVRRWQPTCRMIEGVEREAPIPFSTKRIDKHPRTGKVLENALLVWSVNVWIFKDLVSARITRATTEPETKRGRIHLASDLPQEWLTQVASEHKVRERGSGGKEVHRWVLKPGHVRNEAWDLLIYNAAAARLIRCDTMRSETRVAPGAPGPPRSPIPRPRRSLGERFPLLGDG